MTSSYIRPVPKSSPAKKFPSFLSSEKTVLVLSILCWAILALFLVQALHKAYRADGYDLTPRLEAAKALVRGEDPYKLPTPFPLTYPLFLCVLLIPLAWLPYGAANFLWFVLSAGSLWFSTRTLMAIYQRRSSKKEFTLLFGLCFILLYNLMQNNFANGQVNFFVLALCVAALKFLVEKKQAWAGWFLAAAIAVKLTPLILVGYLFLKREWKALLWTVVGTVVFILGLPWLVAGPAVLSDYQGYLFSYVLPTFGLVGDSLSGTFQFKSYLHYLCPFLNGGLLSVLTDLIVLLPLAAIQMRVPPAAPPRVQALLFSAYLAVSLWLSPVSETHHLAALFPAVFILTRAYLWEDRGPLPGRLLPVAGLFVLLGCGKFSFLFYFAAIGICYLLLCARIRKDAGDRR